MADLYPYLRPLLFSLDAERAHNLTLWAMRKGLVPLPPREEEPDPALTQTLCGIKFLNPVGLAAGFDKNAEVIGPCLKLGFGFVEVGTVTPRPQPGNYKPRVFRDPSNDAVINRMGFPNKGMAAFKENLTKFLETRPRPNGVVGVNIGMNKGQEEPVQDYVNLIRSLAPMADYLTVNVSSPNTPGLRDLQKPEFLGALIQTLKDQRKKACPSYEPPIFVKLAPDLNEEQQGALAKIIMEENIEGLILTNTTLERPEYLPEKFRSQTGGLSGKPLQKQSTNMIRNFYRLTEGKVPIIGAGGILNGEDAYEKIKAGASLVQIYSGLAFRGQYTVYYVNKELRNLLTYNGYNNIRDVVGLDHK